MQTSVLMFPNRSEILRNSMGKNIILLSDGTGNSAAAIWRTNVWRLFKALDLSGPDQIAFYDDGVGTSAFKPLALLGGAFGFGLKRNVLHLYEFLCRNYEDGDRIFCFGFSRGAFTIRVVTALVTTQGLIPAGDKSDAALRHEAQSLYRQLRMDRSFQITHSLIWALRLLRHPFETTNALFMRRPQKVQTAHPPSLRFLGLWDTVAAYGLPVYEMTRAIDLYFWPISMRDRDLSQRVERACHALALDDERTTFHPLLWNELNEVNERNEPRVFSGSKSPNIAYIDQERVSQVWFAGMHANVGGGYPDDAMAYIPLDWIASEAEKCGLRFKPLAREEFRLGGDPTGRLYNSRRGLAGYYRYGPRRLDDLNKDELNKVHIKIPKIHESVFQRIQIGVGAPHSGVGEYTPFVLPETYAVVRQDGTIESGDSNNFQTTAQDQARWRQQEKAWDWVYWRGVVYFLTVLTSVLIAVIPVWGKIASFFCKCPWTIPFVGAKLCNLANVLSSTSQLIPTFFSDHLPVSVPQRISSIAHWFECVAVAVVPPVLRLASNFVPSVGKPWIDHYQNQHPLWFVAGVAVIAILISAGSKIENRIHTIMQGIWSETCRHGCPGDCKPADPYRSFWHSIRSSSAYKSSILWMKEYIVPTLFAVLFVYVGFTAICASWDWILANCVGTGKS
jgi:uncharacterized protein (DUF2235 family)